MGLSEKEIRRAKFREDGLRVNGQRRKTNALLREGDRIEVLLETGEERTVNAAARRCGVSRSAYYKYKDAIRPFQDMVHGRIVTIQILLRNQPGALSSVLNLLADRGGNVLTINQAIPGGGAAAVTVGLETSGLSAGLEELLEELRARPEVIRCEVPAG